jgi:hypothetical protein
VRAVAVAKGILVSGASVLYLSLWPNIPRCLGKSRLFFPPETHLSGAQGRSGSSCCAGSSWPPL